MYKLLVCALLLLQTSCASKLDYDHSKLLIDPDVKLYSISTNSAWRDRDGQLSVQVSGVSGKNQSVYYKINWFDENGMKISTSLSQWKKVNLRENADFYWKAQAPSKRAVSYRVNITDDIGDGIIE